MGAILRVPKNTPPMASMVSTPAGESFSPSLRHFAYFSKRSGAMVAAMDAIDVS